MPSQYSVIVLCTLWALNQVAIKVAFPESFEDPSRGRVYRKLFLTEAKLAGKAAKSVLPV